MIQRILLWAFISLCLYFPLFLHLDYMPIRNYDEARLAVNALELGDHENILVTTFKGQPDTWNTKPPLMVWLQALSMRVFGINELAIRLPAALAALATCFLLIWFGRVIIRRELAGFLAALILVSCGGFTTIHVSRTGDYDALVVLFLTAQVLFGFAWMQEPHRKKYLWLAAAGLALAVLSKSIVGLLFLPALGIYLLLRNDGRQLLGSREPYLAFGSALIVILAYYFTREQLQPGYLAAVWENELGGRYLETLEAHNYSFWYYFKNMADGRFQPWLWLLPFALLWNAIHTQARFTWLALWVTGAFLFIISLSETKIYWYDAPIYPLLSLILGLALADLINLIRQPMHRPTVGLILGVAVFLAFPYRNTIERVYFPDYRDYNGWTDNVYRDAIRLIDRDTFTVAKRTEEYSAHLLFYQAAFRASGKEMDHRNISNVEAGQYVLVCGPGRNRLESDWDTELIFETDDCRFVHVGQRKH